MRTVADSHRFRALGLSCHRLTSPQLTAKTMRESGGHHVNLDSIGLTCLVCYARCCGSSTSVKAQVPFAYRFTGILLLSRLFMNASPCGVVWCGVAGERV